MTSRYVGDDGDESSSSSAEEDAAGGIQFPGFSEPFRPAPSFESNKGWSEGHGSSSSEEEESEESEES